MNTFHSALIAAAIAMSAPVMAQEATSEHRLGDHPAVTVKRLSEDKDRGYDYASKVYPHPAWLYLYPASPDELAAAAANRQTAQSESSETNSVH